MTAYNAYGESPESNIVTARTATKPSNMSPVVFTQTGTDIIISWTPPNSNGSPIFSYKVELLFYLLNDYFENNTICNGTSPSVIANSRCPPIPMSIFTNFLNFPINVLLKA